MAVICAQQLVGFSCLRIGGFFFNPLSLHQAHGMGWEVLLSTLSSTMYPPGSVLGPGENIGAESELLFADFLLYDKEIHEHKSIYVDIQ